MTGTIFDVQRSSVVDGPGIRTTVFFKGCNLKCKWCHNPESQSMEPQMLFYANKCTRCGSCLRICPHAKEAFLATGITEEQLEAAIPGAGEWMDKAEARVTSEQCTLCGKCALVCPADARKVCGKTWTVEEVYREVAKDKAYYDNSEGGVTFSGGECMLQIDFLCACLKKCKENGIHTAVDTAGSVPWSCFEKIIPYTDLFLYDVKCISEEVHKDCTGVSNVLILENLRRLSEEFEGDIMIRVPIIPTVNDGEEAEKIAAFLDSITVTTVEALPYHKMGEHKYNALGMKYHPYAVPDAAAMTQIKSLFKSVT